MRQHRPGRELIPTAPGGLVVRRFTIHPVGCPLHTHDEAEATLVLAGAMRARVGDALATVTAGEGLLVAGGVPHQVWVEGPPCPVLTVQTPPDLGLPGTGALGQGLVALWRAARIGLIAPAPADPGLPGRLASPRSTERTAAVLHLVDALAHHPQVRILAGPAASPDERLDRVLGLVDTAPDDPLLTARAARAAGLTATAFSRWFATAAGTTFREHCAHRRVDRACRLLEADPRAEVDAVAAAAGFASVSAFHRWFRRLTGTTPAAWRQSAVAVSRG